MPTNDPPIDQDDGTTDLTARALEAELVAIHDVTAIVLDELAARYALSDQTRAGACHATAVSARRSVLERSKAIDLSPTDLYYARRCVAERLEAGNR